MEVDGWSKLATQLPKEGLTESKFLKGKKGSRLTFKVMGTVAHGSGNSFMLCADDIIDSGGGDLTVECIHQKLHWLEDQEDDPHYSNEEVPSLLHLQLDNCSVN